jgi:type I restriction enzyme, S subunit
LKNKCEEVKLLQYCRVIKSGVKSFQGQKKYIDTGALETGKIRNSVLINFKTKKSRANMETQKDDIIFAKMKDTEKVYLISKQDEDNIFSTGFTVLRVEDKSKILPKYIYFWLRTKQFQRIKNKECTGATQKALRESKLKKFTIILPTIENQQKIISILEKIDELTEMRANASELTKNYLKSVFSTLFEKTKYDEICLKDLVVPERTISYGIVQPGEQIKNGVSIIRPVDIIDNEIDFSKIKTIDPEKAKVYKKTKLVGGEIIIVVRGEPGASAITDSKVKGFNLTRGTAIIAVDSNKIEPLYLLSFIRSQKAQNYIKLFTKGATLKQINLLDLRNMIVSVPPRKIQKQFLKINEDVIFIKKYQKQSGQNIEELKQNLMNNVFKGEIIC